MLCRINDICSTNVSAITLCVCVCVCVCVCIRVILDDPFTK